MSKKERRKKILVLALPIIGGMLSQNVLNLVDTAMVGNLGDAALAAVGLGGFVNFMTIALILGLSAGVQSMASRRVGEGKSAEAARPLNAALLISLCVGIPFSLLMSSWVPAFFPSINSDPDVVRQGVPYLQARILSMVFVGMNFSFRGYWNAVKLTKYYMGTLLLMHSCNILLNYVLIFGKFGFPELGVEGAGIGSALSMAIGTLCYFLLALKFATPHGFFRSFGGMNMIKRVMRISLPHSIQQLFFAAGLTALFWIVGMVGTSELAAAHVIIHLSLMGILPGIGFGLAAATLVGQSLGKGDATQAKQWGWDVAKVGMIFVGCLALPAFLFPKFFLSGFIYDSDTLKLAELPFRCATLFIAFDAFGLVLMNALIGAGDTKRVMFISIVLQWFLFIPVAFVVGPVWGLGLIGIWVVQAGWRVLLAVIYSWRWAEGSWAQIKV